MAAVISRAGYWFGAGLIVAAIAGAILWGVLAFTAIDDTVDDFVRAPAPGTSAVQLQSRKYIVYLEGPGVGRDFTPPVELSIVDPASDRRLPVAEYAGSLSYEMGGHSGTAAGTVTPPRAGTYEVRAATAAARSAGFEVALGDSVAGRIAWAILGALAIGGILLAAGIGLLVTTGVRRSRRAGAAPPAASEHAGLAGLDG